MSATVTDLFCGAGGSSTGATAAGARVVMAANHWATAVATHQTNFPDTDHDCADISQTDPRRYPRTDILWASPECTNHSQARARRRATAQLDLDLSAGARLGQVLPEEAADRSRATMWDVPRFAEHHRYPVIVVETVVEAARWVLWRGWRHALTLLGYRHRVVYLNSMHAPAVRVPRAPQSRDRLYIVCWRTGMAAPQLDLRPRAWCPSCQVEVGAVQAWKRTDRPVWGRYRVQYLYRCPHLDCRHGVVEPFVDPAASIIDWAVPGRRIADRARPLAEKTQRRVRAGLARWAGRPFVAELRGGGSVARDVRVPLGTVTASGTHHMLVRHNGSRGDGGEMCTPVSQPARTFTTTGHQSLVGWPPPAARSATGSGAVPQLEECTFRMLAPGEIRAAMAFPNTYRVLGTRGEQVRQLGNAVTPPAAEWLLRAVVASLAGGAR